MSASPLPARAILLDIEGTTTTIAFVHETLFSFARRHLTEYLGLHAASPEFAPIVNALRAEHERDRAARQSPPPWDESSPGLRLHSIAAYCDWLMDRDRKSTPLKELQGRIWADGYQRGELVGHVFADVAPALARWRSAGKRIAIFSSGSVHAQRLLFAHSCAGDLSAYLDAYFDTTTGPKREAESYGRIAAALDLAPHDVLFISDTHAELDAARGAGMQTRMAIRPGNGGRPDAVHPSVRVFDEI
jgi:enolase-phosphatase E1